MKNSAQEPQTTKPQPGNTNANSPLLHLENEEKPTITLDLEEPVQLGKETYTEPSTKKLLLHLLENDNQELTPTYIPATGFVYQKVDQILGGESSPQTSLAVLNRLARLDILQKSFFDSAAACPNCQSTTLTVHYQCPQCKSHHISKTSLTEHITCGFIAERERYVQDRCPNCGNQLTDNNYRDMGRWYICGECGEKFENSVAQYICRKCNESFSFAEARMVEFSKYSLNPKRKMEIRQSLASVENISNIIKELGFTVEMPGLAEGTQSGMQHQFSALAKKREGNAEITIAIEHAVGEPAVQASPLIIYIYKISEIKVDLPIFVAIPRLDEAAKKIAQGRNILLIEGNPTTEHALSDLKKQIENRLYHLSNPQNEAEQDGKGDLWKRPLLKREEQKPTLINVVPSIHPKETYTTSKNSSFVNALKRTFEKGKKEKETEKTN